MSLVTEQNELKKHYTASGNIQQEGAFRGRSILPISHSSSGGGFFCMIVMDIITLILGICLWAVATTPSMVFAGKITVLLALAPAGIVTVAAGCYGGYIGINTLRKKRKKEEIVGS